MNVSTTVDFEYQNIRERRTFDVANLDTYDLILGTPFLYQHKTLVGFNPEQVTVRSDESLPIHGKQTLKLASRATELREQRIDDLRNELKEYATPICKGASETPLPPLRAINHVIPLIDEHCVYQWRPSKCPEMMKPLWREKRGGYLNTGRWEYYSGTNVDVKKPDEGREIKITHRS